MSQSCEQPLHMDTAGGQNMFSVAYRKQTAYTVTCQCNATCDDGLSLKLMPHLK